MNIRMVNYCLMLPILPEGGIELVRNLLKAGHTKDHDEFYRIAGISREQIWIQRSPPRTGSPDFLVVSMETNNPANTFKEFATSNHSWAVRLRDYAR